MFGKVRVFWAAGFHLELTLLSFFLAIDTLLRSSALNAGDANERTIVADITEHWVAHLEMQLQSVGSGESTTVRT